MLHVVRLLVASLRFVEGAGDLDCRGDLAVRDDSLVASSPFLTQTGPFPGASAGKSSLLLPNPGVVGLELLLAGPRVGVVGRAGAEGFVVDGVDVSSGSSCSRVVGLLAFLTGRPFLSAMITCLLHERKIDAKD